MYPNIILNLEVSRFFKDSTKNINGLNFDLVNALLPPFLHKKTAWNPKQSEVFLYSLQTYKMDSQQCCTNDPLTVPIDPKNTNMCK